MPTEPASTAEPKTTETRKTPTSRPETTLLGIELQEGEGPLREKTKTYLALVREALDNVLEKAESEGLDPLDQKTFSAFSTALDNFVLQQIASEVDVMTLDTERNRLMVGRSRKPPTRNYCAASRD